MSANEKRNREAYSRAWKEGKGGHLGRAASRAYSTSTPTNDSLDAAPKEEPIESEGASDSEEFSKGEPPTTFNRPFPKAKRQAFSAAAELLLDQGVNTPERLAKLLNERYQGRFNGYTQSLWGMIVPFDETGTAAKTPAPEWAKVYSELDVEAEPAENADNVSNGEQPLNGDRADAEASDGLGQGGIRAGRRGDQPDGRESPRQVGEDISGQQGDRLVSGGDPATTGAQSDSSVSPRDGQDGSTRSTPRGSKPEGSREADGRGSDIQPGGDAAIRADARSADAGEQVVDAAIVGDPKSKLPRKMKLESKENYLYGTLFALVKEQLDTIDVQISRGLGMWAKMRFQARTKEIGKFVTKILKLKKARYGDKAVPIFLDDLEYIESDEELWNDVTSGQVEYVRNILRYF